MAAGLAILLKVFDWLTPINEWAEIEKGNLSVAVIMVERLAGREAELRDAQAALEHLDGLEIGTEPLDEVALLEELVTTIKALRDNLDGDPARGRQVVKRLLQTPIEVGRDEAGGWTFRFRASFLDAPLDLAAPDGTVPLRPTEREFSGTVRRGDSRWCPRRGSQSSRPALAELLRALPAFEIAGQVVRARPQ